MRAAVAIGGWALALLGCVRAPVAEPAPAAPAPASVTPRPAETGPRPLDARVVGIEGDGRTLPIALATEGAALLFTSGPGGVTRWAIDLEGATAHVARAAPVDYRPAGGNAAYDRESDALFWTAPFAVRPSYGPQGSTSSTQSHRVGGESGMAATIEACPSATMLGAESCDHALAAIATMPDGLLLGGSLRGSEQSSAAPWLGLASRTGVLGARAVIGPDQVGGLPATVAALVPGAGSVLAAGLSMSRMPRLGWLTVLHGPSWTSPDRPIATFGNLAESAWVAAARGAGSDYWVAWPRGSGEVTLLDVSDAAGIVKQRTVSGIDVAAQISVSVHVDRSLWLLVCENSLGGPPRRLRLFRLDPDTEEPAVEHALVLPSAFYAHAIGWTAGHALVAGRVGTERPALLVVSLPAD
ncbi:MAG: hypothetical protein IT373_31470 [Polyangiaceae bacterium]|nr:hypothetical protein [Polyangiaceae bacterium]